VRSADRCASERDEVVATSRLEVEQDITADLGADYVDTTDWLCAARACPMMIGDILLYRDSTHLTTVASSWFRPLLEASLDGMLPAQAGGG
jgi:SGNH domain (fused to AT3 domains)